MAGPRVGVRLGAVARRPRAVGVARRVARAGGCGRRGGGVCVSRLVSRAGSRHSDYGNSIGHFAHVRSSRAGAAARYYTYSCIVALVLVGVVGREAAQSGQREAETDVPHTHSPRAAAVPHGSQLRGGHLIN